MSISRLMLIAGAASIVSFTPTFAVADAPVSPASPVGNNQPVLYHTQMKKRFGSSVGWTGNMTIRINAEGIINGQYSSTSIKPDPFYGKIITVTGGLTGKNIRLSFGQVGFTVRGELSGGHITGTATDKGGTTYDFLAQPAPAKSH